MKLLIVLITYNRLKYTQKTLSYLRKTIELPYYLVAVDNNSDDGTQEYLVKAKQRGVIDEVILNPDNYYPGKATNIGWSKGLELYPSATHLMRLDNDMVLIKGWDLKSQEYFEKIPRLGQLGYEHDAIVGHEDKAENHNGMLLNPWPGNVGGPNIIKRAIFDAGIKYNEDRWKPINPRIPTPQEDVEYSKRIKSYGYLVGHMSERLGYTFATTDNWKDFPEYYEKTMTERGYTELLDKYVRGKE